MCFPRSGLPWLYQLTCKKSSINKVSSIIHVVFAISSRLWYLSSYNHSVTCNPVPIFHMEFGHRFTVKSVWVICGRQAPLFSALCPYLCTSVRCVWSYRIFIFWNRNSERHSKVRWTETRNAVHFVWEKALNTVYLFIRALEDWRLWLTYILVI